ncbi:hypothetical protein [Marinobacter mobilis]|uniref:Uncharacterized protein n=1 Tax=Marinobacter mobilis TaxID=488533 RepID=A0A1H2XIW4_9GAMM|nr:hypothetical protein [Marinobacter mobilis]SDW92823.1 hypothetical protein SAMN04487960_10567 [Marinobacter mobilis]
MISTAPERNWLFDPALLKLVHQCRRLIHTEFGIKLHLTDDQLQQQLADYAGKSRSNQLTRVWNSLKEQIPGYDEPEAARGTAQEGHTNRRVYRGQVIVDAPRSSTDETDHRHEAAATTKKKIIYRGQVVG